MNSPVTDCTADGVMIGGERIKCRTIIWGAGVAASPAAEWLKAEPDRLGRVLVGSDLTLPDHPEIFVIGDTAHVRDAAGNTLPGVAPVAKQEGAYAARLIRARLAEQPPPPAVRYLNLGHLATIGRTPQSPTSDFRRRPVAWIVWCLVHLFLIGFQSRCGRVHWLWATSPSARRG